MRVAGRSLDPATLPPDRRPARRFRLQPTPTGVVAIVGLALFLLLAPEVADPGMAGFVWATLLGLVVVGVVWPCVAVLTVAVEPAVEPSADRGRGSRPVRVGEATSVGLRVGNRLAEVSLRWVDGDQVEPVGAGPAVDVDVPMVAVRRGRFHRLSVRVSSDAPFGIATASRVVTVELPRPFEVGPRPIEVDHLADPDSGAVGEVATTAAGHGGDTTRSVRPYVPGDPAHLVHWPTSARVGSLVVREMEPPADRAVAVVVDLGIWSLPDGLGAVPVAGPGAGSGVDVGPGVGSGIGAGSGAGLRPGPANGTPVPVDDATRGLPVMPTTPLADGADRAVEGAVARAAALVADLRARGVRVLLCTAEPAPTVGEVGDRDTVLSRLSAATFGEPGSPPAGWSVRRVTPRGDDG